ncbi:hypothetical protein E2C01_019141 [Portunus trituberculatus]|uniref:Uncharacterized protein n=1 Tax=Portunus trituberculatus TaxID=210409 RepID=A0A5B7DZ65_PORTR|nr:hypothetical protein [Portunus trituberculatus]
MWIYTNIWPPKSWCVYGRSVRTHNDVEGRHHHINLKAHKGQLNFYLLIKLLRDEAKYVILQVHLLSDGKVLRTQQAKYRKHSGKSTILETDQQAMVKQMRTTCVKDDSQRGNELGTDRSSSVLAHAKFQGMCRVIGVKQKYSSFIPITWSLITQLRQPHNDPISDT